MAPGPPPVSDNGATSPFNGSRGFSVSDYRTAFLLVVSRLAFVALPLALIAELAWGHVGALAAVALVLLCAFSYYAFKLAQLSRWLGDPVAGAMPDGLGLWGDVFSRLYRRLRLETRSQRSLSDALMRFEQAAGALPDGAIMLDAENRIEWCNPMSERHFSISLARDRGQLLTNLLRQPAFVAYLGAENYHQPLNIKGQGGAEQVLSALLVPFGEEQKLLLTRDVTQLEKIETMRRDFIANVSHELRTPLTVLSGFVETLIRANDNRSELFTKSLAHMEAQALRMQNLVEDLLALSRLEDARNPLVEHPIDIPGLVASLLVDAGQLSAGRHQIRSSVGDSWLIGNRDELRSAFSNLLSNAVRYTPQGGTIEMIWEMAGNEPVFTVRDSGEGIPAEHIPRLTERFYRVDSGRSRSGGGTGLGLAIVKHVVSRHQARLEIDSAPGKGSVFSVIFPAARACAPSPRLVRAAALR
jgi:two-component system phosphate regulon sensor histidine kinase PhoR